MSKWKADGGRARELEMRIAEKEAMRETLLEVKTWMIWKMPSSDVGPPDSLKKKISEALKVSER